MTTRSVDKLDAEVVLKICSHLCFPADDDEDDGHMAWQTVSPWATSLASISRVSRVWRRPAQTLMLKYLYLDTPHKISRLMMHLLRHAKSDPSVTKIPIAIDTSAYVPRDDLWDKKYCEQHYGAASCAIVTILHTCPNIRFASLQIPSAQFMSGFVSALYDLQGLQVLHLARDVRLIEVLEKRWDRSMSVMELVEKRWNRMMSFGAKQTADGTVLQMRQSISSRTVRAGGRSREINLRLPALPECFAVRILRLIREIRGSVRILTFENRPVDLEDDDSEGPETLAWLLEQIGSKLAYLCVIWPTKPDDTDGNFMDKLMVHCPFLRGLIIDEDYPSRVGEGRISLASDRILPELPPTLRSLSIRCRGIDHAKMAKAIESSSRLMSLEYFRAWGVYWSEEGCEAVRKACRKRDLEFEVSRDEG